MKKKTQSYTLSEDLNTLTAPDGRVIKAVEVPRLNGCTGCAFLAYNACNGCGRPENAGMAIDLFCSPLARHDKRNVIWVEEEAK